MPRRDRRFTGEDVARFYCRHLNRNQRAIFMRIIETCAEMATEKEFLIFLLATAIEIIDLIDVPGAGLISKALEILKEAAIQEFPDEEIANYLSGIESA